MTDENNNIEREYPKEQPDIADLPKSEPDNTTEPESKSAEPAAAHEFSSYAAGEYAGAGVGRTDTVQRETPPYTPPQSGMYGTQTPQTAYASSYQNPGYGTPAPKPKKEKKAKRKSGAGKIALVLVACLVISGCAGFGGALLYESMYDGPFPSENNVQVNKVESSGNAAVPEEGTLAAVIAEITDTVVEIRTETVVTGSFFGDYISEGAGSGVIISEDGYIITNNHVINGAKTITVHTKDGTEYSASLVATDAQSDVAVIRINASGLHAATLGVSADLVVGEQAIAIGNPLGELGGTVTLGHVSALDREINIQGTTLTLLQTDAAINPGNSGGGLFNAAGELIGIVNAKSSGDDVEGLGFAIPIDTAFEVATNLIETGYVTGRPAIGIQIVDIQSSDDYYQNRTTELGKYIESFGVYIVGDSQDNFTYGDRIVAIDGTTVSDSTDISEILSEHKIGDTITVTVSRSRRMVDVEVTLIEMTTAG